MTNYKNRINLDKLHDILKGRVDEFATIILPNAKKQTKGYRAGDIDGNTGQSLWFHEDGFVDHATGEKGSLIKLASLVTKQTIPAAARHLAEKMGIAIERDETYPECQAKNLTLEELSEKHAEYLTKRGLNPEIAKAAGVKTASDGTLAIPLFDAESRLVGIKYYRTEQKAWHAQLGSANVLWPVPYILEHFPDSDTIYVTEGQWDALAAIQAGFPAVSIPNGSGNLQWIENCFNFIHSFPNIVLCYDNDDAGALGLTNATNRLSKGVEIIDYPDGCKDLNDILQKYGEGALKAALEGKKSFTPANVVSAFSLLTRAREPEQYLFSHNTPFGPNFPFQYRDHESTVYTAYTGHGKSNYIRQVISGIALLYDERCFIASFEDMPVTITRELIRQLGHQTPEAEVERVLRNINLYDTAQITSNKKTPKVKPTALIELFEYQYKRYGYSHFVVDNLMTLAVNRQDNADQSEAAELFRQFVISYPVHLHLIAHPRKPQPNNNKLMPPDPSEIRGASEIADAAFNIVGIVRNIPKEREMAKLKMIGNGQDVIAAYDQAHPDSIIHINKQRATGLLPVAYLWFDPVTKTFRNKYQP